MMLRLCEATMSSIFPWVSRVILQLVKAEGLGCAIDQFPNRDRP
jgi:hypothetical protein